MLSVFLVSCFILYLLIEEIISIISNKRRKPPFFSCLGNCRDIVYTSLQVFLLIVFTYLSWHMHLYFKPDLLFSSIITILCCWIIFCCHFGNYLCLIKAMLKSLRSSLNCWPNSSLLFLCIWLVVEWLHPRALQNNDYIFFSLYAVSYFNFSQSQYNVLLLWWWLPAPSLFPDTSAAACVLSQCLAEIQNWTPQF